MTKPVTWDQIIEAAKSAGTHDRGAGQEVRGLHGVDQRAGRGRGRRRSSTNPGASPDHAAVRPGHPGGQERALPSSRRQPGRRRRPGHGFHRRDGRPGPVRQRQPQRVPGELALHVGGVARRRASTSSTTSPGRATRARWPAGSPAAARRHRARRQRASTKQAEAWDAIECITSRRHQKLYMLGTGNPAANKTVYDDPDIKQQFPMAALIRVLPRRRRASAADPVLRRRVRRDQRGVQPALRRSTPRPPPQRRRNSSRTSSTDRHCYEHSRPPAASPAPSDRRGRRQAPAHRPRQARADARVEACRPGVRRHGRRHRLPDPAGGVELRSSLSGSPIPANGSSSSCRTTRWP